MKKTMNFAVTAAMMLSPAIVLAAATAQTYDKFELTKAETKTVAKVRPQISILVFSCAGV
jgi:hypothetical protein